MAATCHKSKTTTMSNSTTTSTLASCSSYRIHTALNMGRSGSRGQIFRGIKRKENTTADYRYMESRLYGSEAHKHTHTRAHIHTQEYNYMQLYECLAHLFLSGALNFINDYGTAPPGGAAERKGHTFCPCLIIVIFYLFIFFHFYITWTFWTVLAKSDK